MEKLRKQLEVHLELGRISVTPQKKTRAYKINEKKSSDFKEKGTQLFHAIFDYLDVEKSGRYQREPSKTFCNIYAYDFCSFTWAYLPRVYWDKNSFPRVLNEENVEATYGKTVRELNANSLYDFLVNEGKEHHNWKEVESAMELQKLANEGHVCLISGKNKKPNESGHITVVSPEYLNFKMEEGIPVQSQAGASNFKYKAKQDWYLNNRYCNFGFFVNMKPNDTSFKNNILG